MPISKDFQDKESGPLSLFWPQFSICKMEMMMILSLAQLHKNVPIHLLLFYGGEGAQQGTGSQRTPMAASLPHFQL